MTLTQLQDINAKIISRLVDLNMTIGIVGSRQHPDVKIKISDAVATVVMSSQLGTIRYGWKLKNGEWAEDQASFYHRSVKPREEDYYAKVLQIPLVRP